MRKMNLKKIAAFVLAGTMAIGMSATVFAADNNSETTSETTKKEIESVEISKKITTEDNYYWPNTTFTFSVENGTVESTEEDSEGNSVKAGKTGGLTVSTTNDDIKVGPNSKGTGTSTDTATLTVNKSVFTETGVYKYVVTENEPASENKTVNEEGIGYSSESYNVYLYVYTDDSGALYVGDVVAIKDGATAKSDKILFENTYTKGNKTDDVHDITVKKTVTGEATSSDQKFSFTVKVDGAEGEKYVIGVKSTENGTEDVSASVESDSESGTTVSIPAGGVITVYGLTKSDKYTITEADAKGYTTKVKVNNEEAKTAKTTSDVADANDVIEFINNKESNPVTGIIMGYAPYIAMIAAACVLAVVFFNRKREDA